MILIDDCPKGHVSMSDMIYLITFQDPFKYSYPPLPDDDFQTPICDNGPIVSEDETESKEGEPESKDALESSFNSEVVVKPKKVHFLSALYQSAKINSLNEKKIILTI